MIKPIFMIAAGQEVAVWPESSWTLRTARNEALRQGGHVGRSPDEWEVRSMSGLLQDLAQPAHALAGEYFFVSPVVGAGG